MDSYAQARFRAKVNGKATPPARKEYVRTAAEVAELLMATKTMDEIKLAAQLLGLTFKEAYTERARLFAERFGI